MWWLLLYTVHCTIQERGQCLSIMQIVSNRISLLQLGFIRCVKLADLIPLGLATPDGSSPLVLDS